MAEIKWQEPPPDVRRFNRGHAGKWGRIAEQLRANPGKWALVVENDSRAANSGAHALLRRYKCQVTTRGGRDQQRSLWARWVAPAVAAVAEKAS